DSDVQAIDGQQRLGGAHGCVPVVAFEALAGRPGRKRRARGSNASRTASANRFAASTSASRKMNAVSRFHHTMGSRDISTRARSIIEPKEFMLGSTPMPRYDSTAS